MMFKNKACCPSCGRRHVTDRWRFPGNGNEPLSVFWCGHCHFGWRHPFPTQAELKRRYTNQAAYSIDLISESMGGFPHRIKRLGELMPQRGKLLDVGSGLGTFLQMAQTDGWQVEGIEPRVDAVRFCYEHFGVRAHLGFLESHIFTPCIYDLITLWDVLEHVSDHIGFLERTIDLLKPGGLLVLAIPNASGWPARIFKGRWRYVMLNHLNYFKMSYVEHLLAERNLHIERADHTLKIHSLIQGISYYLPFKVSYDRLFRMGIDGHQKPMNKNGNAGNSKASKSPNPFKFIRKSAYTVNMVPLPWGIGDMVDLYCRKR